MHSLDNEYENRINVFLNDQISFIYIVKYCKAIKTFFKPTLVPIIESVGTNLVKLPENSMHPFDILKETVIHDREKTFVGGNTTVLSEQRLTRLTVDGSHCAPQLVHCFVKLCS
jgi:hypothetical protein